MTNRVHSIIIFEKKHHTEIKFQYMFHIPEKN